MVANEYGDCLSCLPGIILAEVSSGKYCVNNNNKDSYSDGYKLKENDSISICNKK